MQMEHWIQLLVPVMGVIVAAVSAALTYLFAKKKQILADESRLKEQCYLRYIEAISNNVNSDDFAETRRQVSDAHNQILLIGSPTVVQNLRAFTRYISVDNKGAFVADEHDRLLTELIKSMRYDLYKKKAVNRDYPPIAISGKHKRE